MGLWRRVYLGAVLAEVRMTGDPILDGGMVLILVVLAISWRGIFRGWNS